MENILIALAAILGPPATVIGAVWASKAAARSAIKADQQSREAAQADVEALAYERARETYEDLLAEVRQSATEARAEASAAKAEASAAKAESAQTSAALSVLRRTLYEYEQRHIQLEGELRANSLPIPAWIRPSNVALLPDKPETT